MERDGRWKLHEHGRRSWFEAIYASKDLGLLSPSILLTQLRWCSIAVKSQGNIFPTSVTGGSFLDAQMDRTPGQCYWTHGGDFDSAPTSRDELSLRSASPPLVNSVLKEHDGLFVCSFMAVL